MRIFSLCLILLLSVGKVVIAAECTDPNCELAHIVSFGRTGSGKSRTGNRLTSPGTFVEGNSLESETTVISSAVSWNGDIYADVPGYFDTKGRDQIQQANFVDYLKGKTIRAILFIFTDRLDYFAQTALDAFRNSNLKDNIILVCNKDTFLDRKSDIEDYQGFPVIYIKVFQDNVDVLKQYISKKVPVKADLLVAPASLFTLPITITGEEEVNIYIKDETIQVVEKVTETRQVPIQVSTGEESSFFEKVIDKAIPVVSQIILGVPIPSILGGDSSVGSTTEIHTLSDTKEVLIDKTFKIFHVYKLTYALRFDGVTDIYKRDFLRSVKEPIRDK